jgi:SAM-dependent methyltransferase
MRDSRLDCLRRLELRGGDRALDVGCGAGDMVLDLMAIVAPGVRGVGIDVSDTMIEVATQRAAERTIPAEFIVGDAHALDFPDGTFQGVTCTRVLQHVEDPSAAVREMARVLAPGGRIVLLEPDWDGWTLDADDLATTRAVRDRIASRLRQPDIGRRLRRLALEAGLDVIDFEGAFIEFSGLELIAKAFGVPQHLADLIEAGTVDPAVGQAWWDSLVEADSAGTLFMANAGFRVCARKGPVATS